MRAEATHRLLLNAPLFSKMAFEVVESKYVRLSVIEDGKNKTYLVKVNQVARLLAFRFSGSTLTHVQPSVLLWMNSVWKHGSSKDAVFHHQGRRGRSRS